MGTLSQRAAQSPPCGRCGNATVCHPTLTTSSAYTPAMEWSNSLPSSARPTARPQLPDHDVGAFFSPDLGRCGVSGRGKLRHHRLPLLPTARSSVALVRAVQIDAVGIRCRRAADLLRIVTITTACATEELPFRGYLPGQICRLAGRRPGLGALRSLVAFGLVHFPAWAQGQVSRSRRGQSSSRPCTSGGETSSFAFLSIWSTTASQRTV